MRRRESYRVNFLHVGLVLLVYYLLGFEFLIIVYFCGSGNVEVCVQVLNNPDLPFSSMNMCHIPVLFHKGTEREAPV